MTEDKPILQKYISIYRTTYGRAKMDEDTAKHWMEVLKGFSDSEITVAFDELLGQEKPFRYNQVKAVIMGFRRDGKGFNPIDYINASELGMEEKSCPSWVREIQDLEKAYKNNTKDFSLYRVEVINKLHDAGQWERMRVEVEKRFKELENWHEDQKELKQNEMTLGNRVNKVLGKIRGLGEG